MWNKFCAKEYMDTIKNIQLSVSKSRLKCQKTNRRYGALFVILVAMTIFASIIDNFAVVEYVSSDEKQTTIETEGFKTLLPGTYNRKRPKILLWTTFFGSMVWYEESKNVFTEICNSDCSLTANKSDIESADAIVFHLHDITWGGHVRNIIGYPFPKYRRPNQVWILHNMEPITMLWDSFSDWQGIFNWTWSYPTGSDIFTPYGQIRSLTSEESKQLHSPEKVKSILNRDYFGAKPKPGGISMISHCSDEAQRYKIIESLRKYLDIDVFGKCGKPCPVDYGSCNNLLQPYKFYFALENSNCRDYVTEKYWRSLERDQIPVVAWKFPMNGLVIPDSYINVYDFKDLDEAGLYIKKVSENRTLFNNYFNWKEKFKMDPHNGYCKLCEKLKDSKMQSQVYHDMSGWLTNAGCLQATVARFLHRIVDRFMFDGHLL